MQSKIYQAAKCLFVVYSSFFTSLSDIIHLSLWQLRNFTMNPENWKCNVTLASFFFVLKQEIYKINNEPPL